VAFTGNHLLIDLFDCAGLDDAARVERVLRNTVAAAGATLIDFRLHGFGPGQGVTAIALLAESHISIHSWPEHGYAAVDLFLCGERHDLDAAVAILIAGFAAKRHEVKQFARGLARHRDRAGRSTAFGTWSGRWKTPSFA
jgi:S-adenosylmethionine decarboxylase